ncbi:transcription factor IIIB 60 kDa subunit-like [Zingiber officinale]|uniref:transcription factor IIIB 60 kDa subunit-like n=1 Tax=Zingiber officinale TaxID=94328 RepID=UPI001C4B8DA6|nr:transcription factor IIIB 60 kDa subunit-like [Zingiber officinale]
MGWCTHCNEECAAIYQDPDDNHIHCATCENILTDDMYFETDSSGQILQDTLTGPYERALKRGRDEISNIVSGLRIRDEGSLISCASWFHRLAEDKEFTKERKIPHVAAACLYLACKTCKMNYLLIDFSNYLQINVYVLGAVFLQLCQTLNLLEHKIIQNLVDPSFFIHRFTERRIPSGLCGAALYMSALSHGLDPSKSNIVSKQLIS